MHGRQAPTSDSGSGFVLAAGGGLAAGVAGAAVSTKIVLDNAKSWGLDKGRTAVRFRQLWKQAPAASRMGIAVGAITAAGGAALLLPGAVGFGSRLDMGKLVESAVGSKDAIRDTGMMLGGALIIGGGLIGPRAFQAARAKSTVARQMRSAVFDLLRGPTTASTPTSGMWGRIHQASQSVSMAKMGLTFVVAGTGINAGLQIAGSDGLLGTREGRTGLAMAIMGGVGAVAHGTAMFRKRPPGMSALKAMTASPWLMDPKVRTTLLVANHVMTMPFMLNEAGAFDGLDIKQGTTGAASAQRSNPR